MTSVMVFTRDLRVRDNPALVAAAARPPVVPLFVFDDVVLGGRHGAVSRVCALRDALGELDAGLRRLGGGLVVRRGVWADEVARVVDAVGGEAVHVSADVSGYARRRVERLRAVLGARASVTEHPGITVVPPGAAGPAGGGPGVIFTPYFRKWSAVPWREVVTTPASLPLPEGIETGTLPTVDELVAGTPSPGLIRVGETSATDRLRRWAAEHLARYDDERDDLAAAATSAVSADLHFGCLSPLEVATRLRDRPGGAAFVRQLCWRDFYAQLLAARPEVATHDVRGDGAGWVTGDAADDALGAWVQGRTGFPVVDAGMRQLQAEGYVHNRARLVVASFLCKDLGIDWRRGADHFMAWLRDGDLASNQLNWQWTAGTGTDANPYRVFNPTRQGERFDPTGAYVRRWVPELADVGDAEIHDPSPDTRRRCGYPAPIVDHADAIAAYRARTTGARTTGAGAPGGVTSAARRRPRR